jgi:hypothetical protein
MQFAESAILEKPKRSCAFFGLGDVSREGMRTTKKKIRYRLEWLGLKFATKFLSLLSRKA